MDFIEEKIPVKIFHVAIDSRFRDKAKYPNAAEYIVEFPQAFKNVVYVQLVLAIYDKFGTEQYVNLYIDELASNLVSNNNIISGAFTQLPLIHPLNKYDQTMFESVKLFEQPLSKLGRLSIKMMSYDGSLYPIKDHYLRFEIACCKYDASVENRNLEVVAKYARVYLPSRTKTQTIQENIEAIPKTPIEILDLPSIYTLQTLIQAFRRKKELLRMQNADAAQHQEVISAFKTLSKTFKSKKTS